MTESAPASPSGVAPLRHLGRLRLVAVGLNSVIGGGIFVLPATVTALVGAASLPIYLVVATFVLLIGTVLGRLARRHDGSGGPYVYVEEAFGPLAGFVTGWLFCLSRLTAFANLVGGVALYVGALVPATARPVPRALIILACATAVTWITVAGIRQAARAFDVLAILKIAPLIVLGVLGLALIQPERLVPGPVEPAAFVRSVLLLVFAFTGFEILTVPAEESRRPRSDMPFALVATILSVSAVYLIVHATALGALPDLGHETAPLASVAGLLWGGAGRTGMTALAGISMMGCALAALVGASRVIYAMGSARQVPDWMGALDPVRRTPARAALLFGLVGTALAITANYGFLAAVSGAARLLVFLGSCLACLRLRDGPQGARPGRVLPAIAAAAIGVALLGLQPREVVFGMMGVGAGMGLYLIARRARLTRGTREAT
ncbi:MAG TPA: APC family permease [Patescibacteria group bacterium]|nr:APC family permease [Patescibacteria group bacterium]